MWRREVEQRPYDDRKRVTILVIDDEQTVRRALERLLVRMGYAVLLADSGNSALLAYAEKHDLIDYVLLDHMMPDMNGTETFHRLRELDPSVKVILSSGYSRDDQIEELLRCGAVGFVQKPFEMQALLAHLPLASSKSID
jgi:two-component system, cell cycle sensor histidine kinase and response regulator CckA